MTPCEILGLHNLVRARRFDHTLDEWRSLYWTRGGSYDRIPSRPDYQDGLACVRCDHFEPSSGSPSHPPTTTRAART